jgi:4-hydroxybenzoate polyprenyltransferase
MITFACNINCLYDIPVDNLYKKKLSNAAKNIGVKKIKTILFIEVLIIIILIIYLVYKQQIITSFLAIIGLILSIIYSASPLRLKAKGFLSPFAVIIGLYTLPILGGWFLIKNSINFYLILFVIGYAFMNEGFTLVNTCEDYAEDKKTGIKTWAHIIGIKNTLIIALIFSLFGFLSIIAIYLKISEFNSFTTTKLILSYILIVLSVLTISYSSIEVLQSLKDKDLEKSSKKYAKKMPKWFMITRYPLMFLALVIII